MEKKAGLQNLNMFQHITSLNIDQLPAGEAYRLFFVFAGYAE